MLFSLISSAVIAAAANDTPTIVHPNAVAPEELFGYRAHLDGDRLIASSVRGGGAMLLSGLAYVFEEQGGSWVEQGTLDASNAQTYASFGEALALEGDLAIVGAPRENGTREDQGAVYAFRHQAGTWVEVQRIVSLSPTEDAKFGQRLALSGDRLAIVATGVDTGNDRYGIIDVHVLQGSTWRSEQVLQSTHLAKSWFGEAIDLDGDRLVSTVTGWSVAEGFANQVSVHERVSGTWTPVAQIPAPPGHNSISVSFGESSSLEGDTLLIASPRANIDDNKRVGLVFAYGHDGSGWVLEDTLRPPTLEQDQYFGLGLSRSGDRAVVGAPASLHQPDARLHTYRRSGERWGLERTFTVPVGVDSGSFAWVTGAAGDRFLGTALNDDTGGPNSGSVLAWDLPPAYASYCDATDSSLGEPAHLFLTGPARVSAADLALLTRPMPDQTGLVFLGDARIQLPFGDGVRCVGGSLTRIATGLAVEGELTIPFDPQALGITPGQTVFVQTWYRDPAAGGTGFNLSDAIEIRFES